MHVIAFNGSPRADGNTGLLIETVFGELRGCGMTTEVVHVGGLGVRGCTGCRWCFEHAERRCVMDDDAVNGWISRMIEADGIILASPTYFADITPEIKALMDRAGYVTIGNGRLLRRKVGAAITVARRGGQVHAFDSMNHFFLINEMIVPGSTYWNMGIGRDKGDVAGDEEGLNTMRALGQNLAWLLERLS